MGGRMDGAVGRARPWRKLAPPDLKLRFADGLAMFHAAVARAPDAPAVIYFDDGMSYRELDLCSDALAAGLQANGFLAGDRLALFLQNTPQFVIAVIAAWKLGGVAAPINPMNRAREVVVLLEDCTPRAMICQDDLFHDVMASVPDAHRPSVVLLARPQAHQARNDPRVLPPARTRAAGDPPDLEAFIEAHRDAGSPAVTPVHDLALLVYTSGTTGVPKAAMIRHEGFAFNAQGWSEWTRVAESSPIMGIAPLFHITGLVGNLGLAFYLAAPLIQTFRFEPSLVLEAIAEHRPGYMVGAITAYIALTHHPDVTPDHFASFTCLTSGGAPIPPATVADFQRRFGLPIYSGSGLTETSGQTHMTPFGLASPVSEEHGALAVGIPVANVDAWIAGDDGEPLPVGGVGEIVVSGPQICAGYWRKPADTSASFRDDGFRTGDVGYMDADGWFYVVDRKKDMINSSGYKVWPREVEDVLYTHPAVREVAVIGVPDPYRGETVKAVVSLKPDADVSPAELIEFCRASMAAYKYPRLVEIVPELPKTLSGKILRRVFRDEPAA